jgi:hypothetical protein
MLIALTPAYSLCFLNRGFVLLCQLFVLIHLAVLLLALFRLASAAEEYFCLIFKVLVVLY